MPYIDALDQGRIRPKVAELADEVNTVGELNYAITQLVLYHLQGRARYADYNAVMGVLECAKQEFYRRAVAAYEDTKILADPEGDLYDGHV